MPLSLNEIKPKDIKSNSTASNESPINSLSISDSPSNKKVKEEIEDFPFFDIPKNDIEDQNFNKNFPENMRNSPFDNGRISESTILPFQQRAKKRHIDDGLCGDSKDEMLENISQIMEISRQNDQVELKNIIQISRQNDQIELKNSFKEMFGELMVNMNSAIQGVSIKNEELVASVNNQFSLQVKSQIEVSNRIQNQLMMNMEQMEIFSNNLNGVQKQLQNADINLEAKFDQQNQSILQHVESTIDLKLQTLPNIKDHCDEILNEKMRIFDHKQKEQNQQLDNRFDAIFQENAELKELIQAQNSIDNFGIRDNHVNRDHQFLSTTKPPSFKLPSPNPPKSIFPLKFYLSNADQYLEMLNLRPPFSVQKERYVFTILTDDLPTKERKQIQSYGFISEIDPSTKTYSNIVKCINYMLNLPENKETLSTFHNQKYDQSLSKLENLEKLLDILVSAQVNLENIGTEISPIHRDLIHNIISKLSLSQQELQILKMKRCFSETSEITISDIRNVLVKSQELDIGSQSAYWVNKKQKGNGKDGKYCTKCKKKGHTNDECFSNKKTFDGKCNDCKKHGHRANECRKKIKDTQNKKDGSALATQEDQTLVKDQSLITVSNPNPSQSTTS